MPVGWVALQAPLSIRSSGSLDPYREWLVDRIQGLPGRVVLSGHSMGAAMAVLAAAEVPERIAGLVLVGPAGLPISKPFTRITHDFLALLAAGRFRAADVLLPVADVVRAPRAALRVAREVRRLDLSKELARVRDAAVPAAVIACATDTMTTPASARRIAALLGARYRELRLEGGHDWMFGRWHLLAQELASATSQLEPAA